MQIKSKLPHIGTTIFTIMSKLAGEQDAINLSQGFPDFDAHPELIDLVGKYMKSGHNQYAPMQGVAALRERISEKVQTLYQAEYHPETEITITSGATEALFSAISAVVEKGDEVVIFEPAFDSYEPAVLLNGGIPVYLQMKFPDYHIDWNEVVDALTPKTKLIILNSPHNPTGTVLLEQDISALRQIMKNRDLYVVSDEVYEHIIFDNIPHHSLSRYPDLADKSFVISSFGKTYHTTGWKIGYCLAPAPMSEEFRKIHQYVTFAANTPVQCAYAEILLKKELYLDLSLFYQEKRDRFLSLMAPSRFKALPCLGTYFQMMDFSEISEEADFEFVKKMTLDHKVAAIPPSAFYHRHDDHNVVRFCFAKKDETLEQAADILCAI